MVSRRGKRGEEKEKLPVGCGENVLTTEVEHTGVGRLVTFVVEGGSTGETGEGSAIVEKDGTARQTQTLREVEQEWRAGRREVWFWMGGRERRSQ